MRKSGNFLCRGYSHTVYYDGCNVPQATCCKPLSVTTFTLMQHSIRIHSCGLTIVRETCWWNCYPV